MPISQEQLKQIVFYNPETGDFSWRNTTSRVKAGELLRSIKRKGTPYYRTRIKGDHYLLHRLAFIYMLGEDPRGCIDHINRNSLDNRWDNLRLASNSENSCNARSKNCNIGVKGLSAVTIRGNNYLAAQIIKNGVMYRKYFKPVQQEEAITWITDKRNELHGEFACHEVV
jgi:hypothetical protein